MAAELAKRSGQREEGHQPDGVREEPAKHEESGQTGEGDGGAATEALPTRFVGTVMLSAGRPAKEMHQIVEAIVEQLTTIPGADVTLKLEIDAEVASGLDRSKVRTLTENATTLGFIDKMIK